MQDQAARTKIEGLVQGRPEAWAEYAQRYNLDEAALEDRLALIGSVIAGETETLKPKDWGLLGHLGVMYLEDDEYGSIALEPRVRQAQEEFIRSHGDEEKRKINHYTEWGVFYEGLLFLIRSGRHS